MASSDLEFIEGFALAPPEARSERLKTLVPGSREHFLYTVLVAEQSGWPAPLIATLEPYITSHGEDDLVRMYRGRRALMSFDVTKGPSNAVNVEAIDLLKQHLSLYLSHTRPHDAPSAASDAAAPAEEPAAVHGPSALTPAVQASLTEEAIFKSTLAKSGHVLVRFLHTHNFAHDHPVVQAALRSANDETLVHTLMYLLDRGVLPDMPTSELVELLARAVKCKYSVDRSLKGNMYRALNLMTMDQLLAWGEAVPTMVTEMQWASAVLRGMAPPSGTDFRTDRAALSRYLDQVHAFISGMPPVCNNARCGVLYHKLKLLQQTGNAAMATPEAQTLLEQYLQMPRMEFAQVPAFKDQHQIFSQNSAWVNPGSGDEAANSLAVPMPSQPQDREIIRAFLLEMLAVAADRSPWDKYLPEPYLKALQAEAKLTRGSDAERDARGAQWAKEVPNMAELRDRIVLQFGPANPEYVGLHDPVVLKLSVKNAPRLTVSVFEISVLEYYQNNGAEISSDIPLDGLVAGTIIPYDLTPHGGVLSPFKQQSVDIRVPLEPGRRGVWVVEVLAAGRSCRAIIRRGALRFLERKTLAGHVLTVLDETNKPVPRDRVCVYMGGRKYKPQPPRAGAGAGAGGGAGAGNGSGEDIPEILIPYGANGKQQNIILCFEAQDEKGMPWTFASLHSLSHQAEQYNLDVKWFVEREQLIKDNYNAVLLLRPKLLLLGSIPAPLAALSNVRLTIAATDSEGQTSERVSRAFTLSATAESSVPFAVPANLRQLQFTLRAEVEILANGSKQELSSSHNMVVNQLDAGEDTRQMMLRYTNERGYALHLLGKTGEPYAGTQLTVYLEHALVRLQEVSPGAAPVCHSGLVTGEDGTVVLGHLPSFTSLRVEGQWGPGSSNRTASFDLPQDLSTYPTTVHTVTRTPALPEWTVPAVPTSGGALTAALSKLKSVFSSEKKPASPGSAEAAAAPATPVDVQARVPFRPFTTNPATYVLTRADVRLVEVRPRPCGANSAQWTESVPGTVIVRDNFENASFDAATGFVVVKGLPQGTYQLTVKRPFPGAAAPGNTVTIHVLPASDTAIVAGHLTCGNTILEGRPSLLSVAATAAAAPLQIASVSSDFAARKLVVRVVGGLGTAGGPALSPDVRVHVIVNHFVPLAPAGSALVTSIPGLSSTRLGPVRSRFLNDRVLGEELRYVLERQEKVKAKGAMPGNLLPRPALLLNPWSLGTVSTETASAAGGSAYAAHADRAGVHGVWGGAGNFARSMSGGAQGTLSNVSLDFLRNAVVLGNLRVSPDTGDIRVDMADLLGLAPGTDAAKVQAALARTGEVFVTVVAADTHHTAATTASVPLLSNINAAALVAPFRDLTKSASSLDPDSHVVQRNCISLLQGRGSSVSMAAAASYTKVEAYQSLDRAFGLLSSLSGNPQLQEWSFLLSWPTLSAKEKAIKYSKWACHEMHVALWWRDPEFFSGVVSPFLSNKRSKTLVDFFLLATSGGAAAGAYWQALEAWKSPVAWASLNAFEQALVVATLEPAEAALAARTLKDYMEVQRTPVETLDRVFKAALVSNSLEASGAELDAMLQQAEAAKAANRAVRAAAAPPPPQPQAMARSAMKPGGAPMAKMMAESMAAPMMAMAAPSMARSAPMARSMAMAAPMPMAAPMMMMDSAIDAPMAMEAAEDYAEEASYDEHQMSQREAAREIQQFRPVDKTEEFAEAQYYRVRKTNDSDTRSLVVNSEFWADFAAHVAECVAAAHASMPAAQWAQPAEHAAAVARALRSRAFISKNFPLVAVSGSRGPAGCLNEMLLALGVVGLQCEKGGAIERPRVTLAEDGSQLQYTAGNSPCILFHQDMAVVPAASASSVLCGQNYVDPRDRHTVVRGQTVEKFLQPAAADGAFEMLPGVVYTTSVVLTNVSSAQQSINVFLHIPQGSLPVQNGSIVSTRTITLAPFSTQRLEYPFSFPRKGTFRHFPVHASIDGALVAYASPTTIRVVSRVTVPPAERRTWRYIAANGTPDEVVAFLSTENLSSLDLSQVLWRIRPDVELFQRVKNVLSQRKFFDDALWAYAFHHRDVAGMREYLAREQVLQRIRTIIGNTPLLESPLLSLAVEEGVATTGSGAAPLVVSRYHMVGETAAAYEHLEYSPLINARAHQLGSKRKILNRAVERQYRQLLNALCYKKTLSNADLCAVVYHLLLQDRVEEAIELFNSPRVVAPADSVAAAAAAGRAVPAVAPALSLTTATSPATASWSTLQYDFLAAYLDFFKADGRYRFPVASAVATAYAAHPVPKWAARFNEIGAQLAEAGVDIGATRSGPGKLADGDSRTETGVSAELSREQQQNAGASLEPSVNIATEGSTLVITYSNIPADAAATLSFHSMDLELLFSTSPFMAAEGRNGPGGATKNTFSQIRPSAIHPLALPPLPQAKVGEVRVPVPAEFARGSAMVTVNAAGMRAQCPYFANAMTVSVSETLGRLRVVSSEDGTPIPRCYVKVFWTAEDSASPSSSSFFKDGYTDLRGCFDFASVSTDELARVKRFALFISSPTHGSLVRIARPPSV